MSPELQRVRSELDDRFTTVWSWIASLDERQIELSDRLPEERSYCEYAF